MTILTKLRSKLAFQREAAVRQAPRLAALTTAVSLNRRSGEAAGAIGLIVLCAVLAILTVAIIRVTSQPLSVGHPTTTEGVALSKVLYERRR